MHLCWVCVERNANHQSLNLFWPSLSMELCVLCCVLCVVCVCVCACISVRFSHENESVKDITESTSPHQPGPATPLQFPPNPDSMNSRTLNFFLRESTFWCLYRNTMIPPQLTDDRIRCHSVCIKTMCVRRFADQVGPWLECDHIFRRLCAASRWQLHAAWRLCWFTDSSSMSLE